jgi:PTH2 family peptidyl-tRNA hydrolase
MKAKAVCVMRTDLRNSDGFKVPKGKLIAQGGHAFVELITNLLCEYTFPAKNYNLFQLETNPDSALYNWLTAKFTKVVLAVDSEGELLEIYSKANDAGLNTVLITDCGDTEFAVPTRTCIGIGPDWEYKIDKITGYLKGFS